MPRPKLANAKISVGVSLRPAVVAALDAAAQTARQTRSQFVEDLLKTALNLDDDAGNGSPSGSR